MKCEFISTYWLSIRRLISEDAVVLLRQTVLPKVVKNCWIQTKVVTTILEMGISKKEIARMKDDFK